MMFLRKSEKTARLRCLTGAALLATSLAANAQGTVSSYRLTDVPKPAGNAVYNRPLRFNENGHALIWSYVRDEPPSYGGQAQINLYKYGVLQNLGFAVGDNYNNTFFMNAAGQVAGRTQVPNQESQYNYFTQAAFHNGQSLVFPGSPNYPNSYSTGVNDAGDVVGVLSNYTTYTREAFLYRNGQTQFLGTFGSSGAEATDINNAGDIIGTLLSPASPTRGPLRRAFLRRNGVLTTLDFGGFSAPETWATKISEAGQVIGSYYYPGSYDARAFRFNGSVMQDIGTLGGTTTTATDINENGDVVGYSALTSSDSWGGNSHAFLKPADGTIIDLGTLGGSFSQAHDVNDNGEVVGSASTSYASGMTSGFVYRNGQMRDLNTLVSVGDGWRITNAVAINNAGAILAEATNANYESRALILSPVSSSNRIPIAQPDNYMMDEDSGSLTMPVLDNDSDPDGDPIHVRFPSWGIPMWPDNAGAVQISSDRRKLIFTPRANFSGNVWIGYIPDDGATPDTSWDQWGNVSIFVNPINDAPIAQSNNIVSPEDKEIYSFPIISDPDGDPLTCILVSPPKNGTFQQIDPKIFYYMPNANFHGTDSFDYKVTDGKLESNVATVTFTVTPVNDPPKIGADNFTVLEDSTNNILDVLANDSDVDGDALKLGLSGGAQTGPSWEGGQVEIIDNGTRLRYTPKANFSGRDSVHYSVSDGRVSTICIAQVTVTPVNDAPVAVDDTFTIDEDANATTFDVLANDLDADGDALFIVGTISVTDPAGNPGTFSSDRQRVTFKPAPNFHGVAEISYSITDDAQGIEPKASATCRITVRPSNDAPIASTQSVETDEDTTKNITLSARDADGDSLEYSIVSGPASGTLSGTAPNLIYTPNANFSGADSFTFKAKDSTTESNVATVNIEVKSVNDAPAANSQNIETDEDTAKSIALTASDVDGNSLEYSIVGAPSHGTLSGTGPNLIYTPNADYNGPDSFTFKASDGSADSNVATVSIEVKAVNDAPTAESQSVETDEDAAKNITLVTNDIDGDSLTFNITTAPANGTLSGTAPNLIYTPNTNFIGSDSFSFVANDGTANSNTATVSISVKSVNDAPVASTQNVTLFEDTAKAIALGATDVDGDSLTYIIVTAPLKGVLSGTGANLTYTPNANANGPDSFSFKANDGKADSNAASVNLNITPVNDAPVATGQSVTTAYNTAKAMTLSASDIDGDALNYIIVSNPTKGTLSGTGATRTYTPNAGTSGADSFTFKANDGQADSNVVTVNITVQPNPNPAKFEVRYVIRDQWNNGFVADVYIKNNGPAVNGWTLNWNFPGNQKITNGWNMKYKQTGASVTANDLGWNKSIATGETITIGFQASYSGTNAKPTAFTLNGQACAIAP